MSFRLFNVVAAAATIAATPVLAEAQPVAYGTSSPVEIVALDAGVHNIAWAGGASFEPGSIALRFVNRSAVSARSVTFVINDGGDNRSIIDTGSFRPGVLIEHTFSHVGGSDFSTATCAVVEVDFADGTAWHAAHTDLVDDAGLRTTDADSDEAADTMDKLRAEVEQLNAEARRVAFRHLGTSI